MLKNTSEQYGIVAKTFHWGLFFLLTLAIIIGNILEAMPKGTEKMEAAGMHKSFGLLLLSLILLRLLWRLMNKTPDLPSDTTPKEALKAKVMHWVLYVLMFAQPISGILMSQAGGHPVAFFGMFELPTLLAENEAVADRFHTMHGTIWYY